MDGTNSICGLDQATWTELFSLAKVLLPGLVMACFGAYYQTRKKSETAIKVGITRLRISAYTDIAALFSSLAEQTTPTLADDEKIKYIMNACLGVGDVNPDYSRVLGTEKGFDEFYQKICQKNKEYQIYLAYKVQKQCTDAIGVFTELKQFLDAFCDTEHCLSNNVRQIKTSENQHAVQEKIDFVYRLVAVLMKNEINKCSLLVCDTIAEQINNISVTYKKYRLQRLANRCMEPIMRWADRYMGDATWKGKISGIILSMVLKDRATMMVRLALLAEILPYIHVADKYSAKEYFAMNESEQQQITKDFVKVFFMQLHHNM